MQFGADVGEGTPGKRRLVKGWFNMIWCYFLLLYIEEYRKIQQRDAQSILLTAILIAMFGNVSEVLPGHAINNVGKQPPLGHWVSWGDSGLGTSSPQTADCFVLTRGCLGNDTYYILLFNDTCIITNIHTINRYWPSDVEMGMGQSRGPQSKGAYPVMDALRQLNLAGNMFMFKALPTKMDETWGSRNARCIK